MGALRQEFLNVEQGVREIPERALRHLNNNPAGGLTVYEIIGIDPSILSGGAAFPRPWIQHLENVLTRFQAYGPTSARFPAGVQAQFGNIVTLMQESIDLLRDEPGERAYRDLSSVIAQVKNGGFPHERLDLALPYPGSTDFSLSAMEHARDFSELAMRYLDGEIAADAAAPLLRRRQYPAIRNMIIQDLRNAGINPDDPSARAAYISGANAADVDRTRGVEALASIKIAAGILSSTSPSWFPGPEELRHPFPLLRWLEPDGRGPLTDRFLELGPASRGEIRNAVVTRFNDVTDDFNAGRAYLDRNEVAVAAVVLDNLRTRLIEELDDDDRFEQYIQRYSDGCVAGINQLGAELLRHQAAHPTPAPEDRRAQQLLAERILGFEGLPPRTALEDRVALMEDRVGNLRDMLLNDFGPQAAQCDNALDAIASAGNVLQQSVPGNFLSVRDTGTMDQFLETLGDPPSYLWEEYPEHSPGHPDYFKVMLYAKTTAATLGAIGAIGVAAWYLASNVMGAAVNFGALTATQVGYLALISYGSIATLTRVAAATANAGWVALKEPFVKEFVDTISTINEGDKNLALPDHRQEILEMYVDLIKKSLHLGRFDKYVRESDGMNYRDIIIDIVERCFRVHPGAGLEQRLDPDMDLIAEKQRFLGDWNQLKAELRSDQFVVIARQGKDWWWSRQRARRNARDSIGRGVSILVDALIAKSEEFRRIQFSGTATAPQAWYTLQQDINQRAQQLEVDAKNPFQFQGTVLSQCAVKACPKERAFVGGLIFVRDWANKPLDWITMLTKDIRDVVFPPKQGG